MQEDACLCFSIKRTERKERKFGASGDSEREARRMEESVPAGEEDRVPSRQEIRRWRGKGGGGELSLSAKIR